MSQRTGGRAGWKGRDHWWHHLVSRQPFREAEDTAAEDVLC
jgi:hypothetical protein